MGIRGKSKLRKNFILYCKYFIFSLYNISCNISGAVLFFDEMEYDTAAGSMVT